MSGGTKTPLARIVFIVKYRREAGRLLLGGAASESLRVVRVGPGWVESVRVIRVGLSCWIWFGLFGSDQFVRVGPCSWSVSVPRISLGCSRSFESVRIVRFDPFGLSDLLSQGSGTASNTRLPATATAMTAALAAAATTRLFTAAHCYAEGQGKMLANWAFRS